MKNSFKKVLSVILAALMLLIIPVTAFAEGEEKTFFEFKSGSIRALSGKWKNDYVDMVEIVLEGSAKNYNTDEVILSIGTNASADNILTVKPENIQSAEITANSVKLNIKLDRNINHSATYYIDVKEGAFVNSNGEVNASFRFEINGNLLVETLEIGQDELPKTPIEQLIYNIEVSKYRWILYPVVLVLRWFISL